MSASDRLRLMSKDCVQASTVVRTSYVTVCFAEKSGHSNAYEKASKLIFQIQLFSTILKNSTIPANLD